jgi:ABC-type bacteriocin/lantibiotic exporter with double-glycine peptidase domain
MKTLIKCLDIISYKSKLGLIKYLLLVIIVSILEVIGISFVIPLVSFVAGEINFKDIIILSDIFFFFRLNSKSEILIFLLISFFLFILLKNLLVSFFLYYESFIIQNIEYETCNKLFYKYLTCPYQFHLDTNSSQLVRNTQYETEVFSATIKSIIYIIAELTLSTFIIIFLLYYEPFGTLATILIILIFSGLFVLLTKKKLATYAKIRIKYHAKVIKVIMEGLQCIKDIKILNKENFFLENLKFQLNKKKKATIFFNLFSNLPRLFLELIAVFIVCILIFLLISRGNEVSKIFTIIGIFVVSVFRLMPSINKISLSYQRFLWGSPSVDALHEQIKKNTNFNHNAFRYVGSNKIINNFKFKNKISLNKVNFNYKKTSNFNIRNISFEINKGESIGIVGKSGSGKSTIINIFLGLLKPSSGEIIIDGVNSKNIKDWNQNVGYVPQNIYLTDDTIFNNIAFGVGKDSLKSQKVKKAIEKSQLQNFVKKLPYKENTIVGEKGVRLSGGQIQRIGIARALYHEPSILVLDEASSALDYDTEINLMAAINLLQGKTTMLIVTHRISTVQNCDKIIEIENGKIKSIKKRK